MQSFVFVSNIIKYDFISWSDDHVIYKEKNN